MNKTLIIAEAGVNHNGKLNLAIKLVKAAKKSGAYIVKFQIAESNIISKNAPKAKYQVNKLNNKETQFSMVKKLELNWKLAHNKIIKQCKKSKIKFLTSPFSIEGLKIVKKLNLGIVKIPSGEINNLPYLEYAGKLKKKVFLSTGMSNLSEIRKAIKILCKNGTKKRDITVLQCNTAYPTPIEDANLNALKTLKKVLNTNVGYSDHTLGIEASLTATALGAVVIEKHLTLNNKMKGPDHKASLNPKVFKIMTDSIRIVEKTLGTNKKKVTPSEKKNINIVRKSIVAKKNISKGEVFSEMNLSIKRPGTGISPLHWYKIMGKKSKKNYKSDDLLKKIEIYK